jgi:MOSC domain-containing protein YiiM
LPKLPIGKVFVKKSGLEGDYNSYRTTRLGGDLTSAVSLLPYETILQYGALGFKVGPGSMGENFTLDGVHYDDLKVGRRIRLGKQVIIRIERVCNPCDELLVYGSEFPPATKGKRGMYASVEEEGIVRQNDSASFL